ncbi:MAG TPA: uroporphyrinogen decarboxylase family protein [Armatimonadota bacterium]
MTHRERALACLNYEPYDRLPLVHFGFWGETLTQWRDDGFLTDDDLHQGSEFVAREKLGFEYEWNPIYGTNNGLLPTFEPVVVETMADGAQKVRGGDGVTILVKADAGSIPAEIEHLLVDRASWEEHYLPRLQFSPDRIPSYEHLLNSDQGELRLLACGSLFGTIRNWVGVVGSAYILADDEALFTEIIDVCADLTYRCVEAALASGVRFDVGHYWEDICFKNGPLIHPEVFAEKVGPHYRRTTDLLHQYGINIVSLDCDGKIDALIPTWLENGVNTMFPIEVGTWDANIAPWRAQYGREIRGVGGMNKVVYAYDKAAVDAEIERLKPLVDLGGFIPCPDHRIPPDAKFENVAYYCERMRQIYA